MQAEKSEWLKVPEVAAELRIPRTRAYELIAQGFIPAVMVGERSIRVNRRELEEFLMTERRTGPQPLHTDEEVNVT